jgi:hypothetical protein
MAFLSSSLSRDVAATLWPEFNKVLASDYPNPLDAPVMYRFCSCCYNAKIYDWL